MVELMGDVSYMSVSDESDVMSLLLSIFAALSSALPVSGSSVPRPPCSIDSIPVTCVDDVKLMAPDVTRFDMSVMIGNDADSVDTEKCPSLCGRI